MFRPFTRSRSTGAHPRPCHRACLLIITFSAAVACARSATAAVAELSLSLDQAAQRAAEASPLVRLARSQRDAADARRVDASILMPANPALAVGAGPTREPARAGAATVGIGAIAHLEQTVEIGGQRRARIDEVSRGIEAAAMRESLAEVEARARARASYVAALLAAAQLDWAGRRAELTSQIEASVRARVDAGAASDIELRLAVLERGRVERDRVEAAQAEGDALADLRAFLALAPDTRLMLTTPLAPPEGPLPALADALAMAEVRRADLAALDARRNEVDAAIVRLGREALPSPTLFLDVERDRPGELLVRAGIGLPLPVWRRRQGEIAVARAERSRLDAERAVSSREVALEVDRALRAVAARREEVRLDTEEVLPAAEAALDLLTQGWQAGKFDLFRVIQASREAGEAHRRALEDIGRLWQARIELDRAVGAP